MEVRHARREDTEGIIALLKLSLGEGLMPKSERYWQWKHLDNPFGASPVIVAEENNHLIGVRAFMRWKWRRDSIVYSAVRAVDTATHPQHKGKGIFKKLTLSLVQQCTELGDDFVFNTPNDQSRPGYIKMGWRESGHLPIKVKVVRPFGMLSSILTNKSQNETIELNSNNFQLREQLDHPGLPSLLIRVQRGQSQMKTDVSVAYLNWRYADVPVANYFATSIGSKTDLTGILIGRIKPGKKGREFRITDVFCVDEKVFRELYATVARLKGVDFVTLSQVSDYGNSTGFGSLKLSGPSVTMRSLCLKNVEQFDKFTNWSPSIGDLELF